MRRTLTAGVAVAAFAATLLAGSGAAQADVGDGSWACNKREICFRKDQGSDQSIKHFWNGANHGEVPGKHAAYRWGGPSPGGLVMDNATEFWNRDSVCTVYVWDIDGTGNWFAYAHQPFDSAGWFYDLRDWNNGHSRCTNTVPPANL
jgi:hypothetical protein